MTIGFLLIILIVYVGIKIFRELNYYRSVSWDFSRDQAHVPQFVRQLSQYFGISAGLCKLSILIAILSGLIILLNATLAEI